VVLIDWTIKFSCSNLIGCVAGAVGSEHINGDYLDNAVHTVDVNPIGGLDHEFVIAAIDQDAIARACERECLIACFDHDIRPLRAMVRRGCYVV
jgi:hypothetical protein